MTTGDVLLEHLGSTPRRAGLFCDFDGTLAPIVDDPADVHLDAAAAALLERLAARLGAVAVVSGRPVRFLATCAAIPGVRLLGLYGLEEWHDGEVRTHAEAAGWAGIVAGTRERLSTALAHLEGVRIEDKGLSVAVHWRNAVDRERAAREVAARARALAAETGLAREPGKLVEELRPPVAWDKGAAVRAVAADADLACLAYIGDDRGDLAAFAAVAALGGVRVAVDHGAETPPELLAAADTVVSGHEGVVALLQRLCDAVEQG